MFTCNCTYRTQSRKILPGYQLYFQTGLYFDVNFVYQCSMESTIIYIYRAIYGHAITYTKTRHAKLVDKCTLDAQNSKLERNSFESNFNNSANQKPLSSVKFSYSLNHKADKVVHDLSIYYLQAIIYKLTLCNNFLLLDETSRDRAEQSRVRDSLEKKDDFFSVFISIFFIILILHSFIAKHS